MSPKFERVLVLVEDSEDDEELSLRGIRQSGVDCAVKVIRHGGEALRYLLDPGEAVPQLIVLDFRLPGLNGLEILRGLRNDPKTKKVPVVILSSDNNGHELSSCYTEGVNSCVAKPMEPHLYLDRIAMIVRYWLDVNDPSTA